MPFQDIDEVDDSEPTPAPSRVEKFLRKVFLEDWSLKLLSLTIALVLWLVVTGQNQPVTAHVNVQLNFIRPQSLEISNDPPRTVDVMLTGSRNKLDDLTALDLVATLDLSDQRAGERVLRLADKAQISLPQGVKVDGFQPSVIPVHLEPVVERQIAIEPKLTGKPADGYEIYAVQPSEGSVTVRGPASKVNALHKVVTESIWISGQKETITVTNVAIDIPDPKVDLLDPSVTIRIEIGEHRIERNFSDVAVTTAGGGKVQPSSTSITLVGPASLIEALKAEEIKLIVDPTAPSAQPRLELPAALKGQFTIKAIQATRFVLVNR